MKTSEYVINVILVVLLLTEYVVTGTGLEPTITHKIFKTNSCFHVK